MIICLCVALASLSVRQIERREREREDASEIEGLLQSVVILVVFDTLCLVFGQEPRGRSIFSSSLFSLNMLDLWAR